MNNDQPIDCEMCFDIVNEPTLADMIARLRDIETRIHMDRNFKQRIEDPLKWSDDVLFRNRGYMIPGP